MTKVEELAESMSQKIWLDVSEPQLPLKDRYRLMKDRIVYGLNAAHAEGVVEGAATEREKIRKAQLCGYRVQVSQFPDDERRNCRVETDVNGVAYTLVLAPVLAPPKEREP